MLWQIQCVPYLDSSSSSRRLTAAALHSLSNLERGSVRTSLYSDWGSCWISISPPVCVHIVDISINLQILCNQKMRFLIYIMWGLNNIMDVVCDLRINKLFTINSYISMYKPTEVQKFSFLCDLFKDQEVIFMTKWLYRTSL